MLDAAATAAGYWVPLVTAFAGFASSQILEWLKDERAYKREHESRAYSREDRRHEQRAQFQSETLLELQEGLAKYLRGLGRIHHQDVMSNLSQKKWRSDPLPEGVSDQIFESNIRIVMLRARVSDSSLRDSLALIEQHANVFLASPDVVESTKMMDCMSKIYDEVNTRIGELLRGLEFSLVVPDGKSL